MQLLYLFIQETLWTISNGNSSNLSLVSNNLFSGPGQVSILLILDVIVENSSLSDAGGNICEGKP